MQSHNAYAGCDDQPSNEVDWGYDEDYLNRFKSSSNSDIPVHDGLS